VKIGISMEVEESANERSTELQEFIDNLSHHIEQFDYGTGIQYFTVGLVCIKSMPGYENWYQQRKPKFKSVEKVKMLDGTLIELHNSFTYDIKFTDEEIDSFVSSKKAVVDLFRFKYLESLSNFQTPSMRKRDFDFPSFKRDVENFLKGEQFA
jgi:hypothetical protein